MVLKGFNMFNSIIQNREATPWYAVGSRIDKILILLVSALLQTSSAALVLS